VERTGTSGECSGLASERPEPHGDEIRAQLERIVSSHEFPGLGRGAAFLRYVVEETIAGRASRIKGYSIAVEVFGRSETFTPDDPVVRIEAGRLRRSLERYYLVEGFSDPIKIDIPKGGYAPTFTWNSVAPVALSEVVSHGATLFSEVRPRLHGRGFLVASTIAVLVASSFWVWSIFFPDQSSQSQADGAPERPALVVAPFANLGNTSDALYTLGLTEELLTALPRFKEIKVFGRETSKLFSSNVDASQVRKELGARYLLAGGVRASGNRLRVTARLLDTDDGEIVWSQDYENDLKSTDLLAIQTDVARRVATAIAQPYGVMAQVDAANPPPDDRGAYECTLGFYAYRTEMSADSHRAVRACLKNAVVRHPNYSTAWAMLSIIYLDEDRFKFNPDTDSTEQPVHRALGAARRATQLDASDTRGLQALMMALFFDRRVAEAMKVGEQALSTNPNDTELMGEFGTRVAISGEWQRGAALLDQAIALNPGGGGYYHGTRALAAYMLHDNATAVQEITKADMQKFPLYHAVAAIIFAEAGMTDDARHHGEIFVRMRPDFLRNVVAELDIRNVRPVDRDRLIAGLRKAGMTTPLTRVEATAIAATWSDLQPR
jgi:adenylate cyclase